MRMPREPVIEPITYLSKVCLRPFPFVDDHVKGSKEDDKTVTYITEHHGEKERERDHGEQAGVDFLVRRDTITVHDRLEAFCELVGPVEGWWRLIGAKLLQDGNNARSRLLLNDGSANCQNTREAEQFTVACRRANWIVVISLVGHHPSATNVFLLTS